MMEFLKLETAIWLAILLVITLRSLAVYSQHFIGENAPRNTREKILGWFRFYKQGFSITLGCVAFFLAAVAFLDGSLPWTLGNLVFGCAAFINFQQHCDFVLFRGLRSVLRSKLGGVLFYGVIPAALFVGLFAFQFLTQQRPSGATFSFTGAYLLAVIFLSMKLEVWGSLSHESRSYLTGVLCWDALLLLGAWTDGNLPFYVLESYALLLDSYTIYLVKGVSLQGLQAREGQGLQPTKDFS